MKTKKNQKLLFVFFVIFILSSGFLFFTNTPGVFAAEEKGMLEKIWGYVPVVWLYNNGKEVIDAVSHPIEAILTLALNIAGFFLNVAVYFFSISIDGNRSSAIMSDPSVLIGWGVIRDICNMAFIVILLFSAFSTVFQYSSYNYKKILMWLVIMALLVNFSFPISRFIIDINNVLMYTVLNNSFPNPDILFGKGAPLNSLQLFIDSAKASKDNIVLFFMAIFTFILAVTIFALGLILFIRTLALTILIIFSPIGFVGVIIGKDGGWWNKLFQYAMAGPIIAIVLYVSTTLMKATVSSVAGTEATGENIIVNSANLSIPIIILWIGIGMAIKGIDGAGTIMGKARNYGKSFAKNVGGLRPAARWISKKSGVTGAVQSRYNTFKKSGFFGSDAVEEREAKLGSALNKATGSWKGARNPVKSAKEGWKSASEKLERKSINAKIKEFEDERMSASTAEGKLDSKSTVERRAAALYLSKKDKINDKNYSKAYDALAGDGELQNELNSKVKKDNHIKYIIDYEIAAAGGSAATATMRNDIYKKHLGDLSADNLAKQKGIHESINTASGTDFANFITNEIKADTELHKEIFKKLSRDQRKAYADVMLDP